MNKILRPIMTHLQRISWGEKYEEHEIIAIEYSHRKPHAVLTQTHNYGRAIPHWWDFDWSRTDGTLYYHNSGGGGTVGTEFQVGRYTKPVPRTELWLADFLRPTVWERGGNRHISNDELTRRGYRLINRPLRLQFCGLVSRNPFEVGEEGETIWCDLCRDHRSREGWGEDPCEHMEWCDYCGSWIYTESRKYVECDRSVCEHGRGCDNA